MKNLLRSFCVFLFWLAAALLVRAQGTAFTYQGRISENGVAINGSNDFTFTLYTAASGGATVGMSNVFNDFPMSNGLFTVTLDFGANFTGAPRWLEIAVRPGPSTSAYTNLAPRLPVTSSPYAIQSLNAAMANISGSANSVAATNITGTILLAQLPATLMTNGASGVNISGTFSGNGAGLSNLSAANLTGAVPTGALDNAWKPGGNSGTTSGTHFVGTTDFQPLELKVNNLRALRLEPHETEAPNLIGGHSSNFISAGVAGSSILGGGSLNYPNGVTGPYAVVLGGAGNHADGFYSTAMGYRVNASGHSSTAIGNRVNASGFTATALGYNTIASGTASLASGQYTTASGEYSTALGAGSAATGMMAVALGYVSRAADYSLAAGWRAKADHPGTFAWADSTEAEFASTGSNQFCVRARGGIQIDPLTSQFFGAQTRQMLNLFNSDYGIGIQTGTLYSRCDNSSPNSGFMWYKGGVHSDAYANPGGGTELMHLIASGLYVSTTVYGSSSGNGVQGTSTGAGTSGVYGENLSGGGYGVAGRAAGSGNAVFGENPNALGWAGNFIGNVRVTGTINPPSDRNVKRDFVPVDHRAILEKVAALSIQTWAYTNDSRGTRHLGPVAQDFQAAFGLGADDKSIATVDADGVALAAIQGLNQRLTEELKRRDMENSELKRSIEELRRMFLKSLAKQLD
jgi:trimeric autotransporter adhesin